MSADYAIEVNLDAALDQSFEFTDESDPQGGDYYYVRVEQADAGLAGSSPIWVNAFSE